MAKVLGLGGVFFRSSDPDALKQWYIDTLGVPATEDPGISFPNSGLLPDGYTVMAPFKADTTYFDPANKEFMLNLVVDDVDGMLERIVAGGGTSVGEIEDYDFGKFGWFMDPEGNKVELWQPKS
jgi:predicted enzyme related to lactoylglutathione lyase